MGFNCVPDVFNEIVVDTSVAVVLLVVVVIIVVIIVVVEGVDVVVSISETCKKHQFDGNLRHADVSRAKPLASSAS